MVLIWILVIIGSYLMGSIPSAYLVVKWRTGQDIRTIGSGNVGATNAVRAVGYLGCLAFVVDVLKGFLPVLICRLNWGYPLAAVAGLCALFGHFFPVWLHFKGGKGVSTSFGIYLALAPGLALIGICGWALIVLVTGYVSLASCLALFSGIFITLFMGIFPFACFWLFCLIGVLVPLRHSSNYRRLIQGKELRSRFYYRNLFNKR